ncbi:MAG TPA: hypothetical protein VHM91_10075, partial [Verrucomicrobiales bacterium]|nr:hypothetical protein [Verrucomicrobiales bacterium]
MNIPPLFRGLPAGILILTMIDRVHGQGPAQGLDSPLPWNTTGSPGWDTVQQATAAGGDVARAAQTDDASMETTVTGPATASFDWRLIGPDGRGWLALEVDGQEMATRRQAGPWQKVEINVPPGEHRLRLLARGMARVPGSAAEADHFVVTQGARLSWLPATGDDPDALWVVTGSGRVVAEQQSLAGIDEGNVAAVRGTDAAGRTSLRRLVQGPARLKPWVNVKGGFFTARDLDSAGTARRVSAPAQNTWDDAPLIVGPGLHRVEWTHFYWSEMEQEKDPYPMTPPDSIQA